MDLSLPPLQTADLLAKTAENKVGTALLTARNVNAAHGQGTGVATDRLTWVWLRRQPAPLTPPPPVQALNDKKRLASSYSNFERRCAAPAQ